MPLYSYRCDGCSEKHEEVQSLSEGEAYVHAPQVCPNCKEEHKQTRLIGTTSFQLSGRGWFRDRYS